ncbi:MAG: SCO family protein [Burkholderiaceae bacterium]
MLSDLVPSPIMTLSRLLYAIVLAAVLGAAGCRSDAPSFKSTDITGAGFAREFTLTDHTGKTRSLADFKGSVLVVFFGYTQCPDVCPTTLLRMKEVIAALDPGEADRVRVAFVSVDPERDTREVLAQYVPAFDSRFIGLFGDLEATKAVTREFKVFYMKVAGSTADNYTVDHTAASYVFDPEGRVRLMIKHGESVENIVHDLRQLL